MTLSINKIIDIKQRTQKRSTKAERRRREREATRRMEQRQEQRKMEQFKKLCAYRDEL